MKANYYDGYYQQPKVEAREDRAILAKKLRDERSYSTQLLHVYHHKYQKRINELTDQLADLANLG